MTQIFPEAGEHSLGLCGGKNSKSPCSPQFFYPATANTSDYLSLLHCDCFLNVSMNSFTRSSLLVARDPTM